MTKEQFNRLKNLLFLCFFALLIFLFSNSLIIEHDLKKYYKSYQKETIVIYDTIFLNFPLEKVVTLTVYNPVENQCDDTPLITANGTKIDLEKLKKREIKYCAVSRDLLNEIPYGSIIYIEGYGEYEVVDTMNKRIKMGVDILQDINEKKFKKTNVKILKIK